MIGLILCNLRAAATAVYWPCNKSDSAAVKMTDRPEFRDVRDPLFKGDPGELPRDRRGEEVYKDVAGTRRIVAV